MARLALNRQRVQAVLSGVSALGDKEVSGYSRLYAQLSNQRPTWHGLAAGWPEECHACVYSGTAVLVGVTDA